MSRTTSYKKLCQQLPEDKRKLLQTLLTSANGMKEKLEQELPLLDEMPLSQTVTSTQGEQVQKANPWMSEFRGLVRDYSTILKSIDDLTKDYKEVPETTPLDEMRKRFRICDTVPDPAAESELSVKEE